MTNNKKILRMLHTANFHYDASSALSLGQRDQQEDAIVADFPIGTGMGFAVLADGMGGHAAGDVASKIVVTEVFSELKLMAGKLEAMEHNIGSILREAVLGANECVRYHSDSYPTSQGMGATLVAPVLIKNRLYWVSVGDSPLFLFRNGTLRRLNEDHSLTAQFDYLVGKGLMKSEDALAHPDRNCLTSVLAGQEIQQIDCPHAPVELMHDDIIIVASDGLQFLAEARIAELITAQTDKSSAEISSALMNDLDELNDPGQDNVSLCVVKVIDQHRVSHQHRALEPEPIPAKQPVPTDQHHTTHTIIATATGPENRTFNQMTVERSS